MPVLNDYPLKDVTVHPRIGKQVYSGRPNLDKLYEVLQALHHKVIYNGDVCSAFDYGKIRSRFPQIKDIMIGRGVLFNPLLPIQIRQQYAADFADDAPVGNASVSTVGFIIELMNEIVSLDVRDEAKIRKVKEYWCLLSKALPGTEESKRKVLHATDLDAALRLIREMAK